MPKPPRTIRIVCLGDSTTFGVWLEAPTIEHYEISYPAELERLARDRGKRVEVVNAGVLGATSAEGLVRLLVQVLPLQPDIVTLKFGNNDHARQIRGTVHLLGSAPEWLFYRWSPTWVFSLRVTLLAAHGYRRLQSVLGSDFGDRRVSLSDFERNLRRAIAIARLNDTRVLLIDTPYREYERGLSPGDRLPNGVIAAKTFDELVDDHLAYQDAARRVAVETSTPFVDTLHALRTAAVSTFSDYDMTHPNAAGYRIVAAQLYEELARLGYLDSSS